MRLPSLPSPQPTVQPRLVIVDRDADRAGVLSRHLADAGYREVITTCGRAKTLDFLLAERPDLVLLGLNAPEEHELDLLQTLCRDPRFDDVPILMLTPPADTQIRAKAMAIGVTDFLYTPVDATELCPRVRNALSLRLLGRQGVHPLRGAAGTSTLPGAASHARPWSTPELGETSLEELKASATVMIVDDQPTIVKVVRKYLANEGYRHFLTTTDSTKALAIIERDNPDVLLLDIMMPDVSGLDILDAVRSGAQSADLPVIILTAATDGATKQRALDLGATEFLAKPIDPVEVLPRVRNALVLRDRQRQLRRYAKDLEREVARHLQQVREYTEALERTNDMLRRSRSAARAAERAKSDFLASMSHEIRTPLTTMIGFAEMMFADLGSGSLAQPDPASLDTIVRNGKHLLEVFNNVLEFSKIEAGRLYVGQGPCSPIEVLADVLRDVRVRAQTKGLSLHAECGTPIPERFPCDPTCVKQILLNLIGNAIKFTERGSVRVTLRLRNAPDEPPRLEVAVVDTGIGIGSEEMARLFHPLTQTDPALGRKCGGTGLGLAICRQLAERMGGSITADSSPGRGSAFRFLVPTGSLEGIALVRKPLEGSPREIAGVGVPPTPPAERHFPCRILLAEDCLDNQRLICCMLRKTVAEIVTAEHGQAACEMVLAAQAAGKPFDLLLMDMQMPVLDGYAATRRLRETGCRVPIVAVTAHAMSGEREKCLAAGCDDYLTKPISRETLIDTIARYLSPPLATDVSQVDCANRS